MIDKNIIIIMIALQLHISDRDLKIRKYFIELKK